MEDTDDDEKSGLFICEDMYKHVSMSPYGDLYLLCCISCV